MGNRTSRTAIVNYDWPCCMKGQNRIPNLAGRFHLINELECQCNGCKTVYPKEMFYKKVNIATRAN